MPRSSWLSSAASATHLPSLLTPGHQSHHGSGANTPSSGANPASVTLPETPGGPQDMSSYFPPISQPSTPAMESGPYGGITNIHGSSWLEILLDHEHVILRGAGGDTNPASLSGRVVLHLQEATNIKEITLTLTGKAKVGFADGAGSSTRSHHHTHLLIHHDWTFLAPPPTPGKKQPAAHSHTLKAGVHSFPFQMTIESDTTIPSTLRTWNNDAYVFYKLRAVAHRSGAFSTNFQATKPVSILRNFTAEALEFTQTLEIENSWPMKVAYSLTLPHKAFTAGDNIPIAVKFQPLAKGVHVTSISTVVKEYTLVHTKASSHPDVRVAASIKHDIRNGRAYVHKDNAAPKPPQFPPHHEASPSTTPATPSFPRAGPSTNGSGGMLTGSSAGGEGGYFPSVPGTSATGAGNNLLDPNVNGSNSSFQGTAFAGGIDPSTASPMDAQDAYMRAREEQREVELGDGEIDTMISIPLPAWTTPSHGIHPVFVTHKVKWSCVISNPDGHTSELRCALPIHVLAPPLAEEARIASSSTRAMLFSLTGDAQAEVQQLELPSYSNHVYDRVANASVSQTSGTAAAGWSRNGSPSTTPPTSRPASRHTSPVLGMSALPSVPSTQSMGDELEVPERPHLNWADSELLLSLGNSGIGTGDSSPWDSSHSSSPHRSPSQSAVPSRPSSRSGWRSRPSSRPSSRASSPVRGESTNGGSGDFSSSHDGEGRPGLADRRGSHGFHIPKPKGAFKALSSLTPSHNKHKHHQPPSSASLSGNFGSFSQSSSGSPSHNNSRDNTPLPSPGLNGPTHNSLGFANTLSSRLNASTGHSPAQSRRPSNEDLAALSQVPSYNVASRGFLGGGVVPLSAVQGLPDYEESENFQRAKSESNLLEMGRRASAAPPSRLAPTGLGTPNGSSEGRANGSSPGGLVPSLGTSLNHASSSALATSLSTTAGAGEWANPSVDDDDELDDMDALEISTKGKRANRSESVSTIRR